MRVIVRRLLGATALCFLIGLPMSGCSGQQQDQEDMEVSEQENEYAENQESEGNNEVADSQDDYQEENQGENVGNDEALADTNNAAENDLQEIIQEMNTQQGTDAAAMPVNDMAAAPPMDPNPVPVAEPVAEAAPAPAAPVSSGPTIPFQPGGTPAAPGLPELGSKMAYIVEQGDTLGRISAKIYGTPGRWKELATLSGIPNPSRIYPGDLVYYTLDESATAFAAAYESTPKAEEPVQQGDTLATIAQRLYGTSTAWRSIWRQNHAITNPDIVPPGTTVFYIPKGAATAAVKKAKTTKTASVKLKKAKQVVTQIINKSVTQPVKSGVNTARAVFNSHVFNGFQPMLI